MILQQTTQVQKSFQAMQARNEVPSIFLLIVNMIMFQVESNIKNMKHNQAYVAFYHGKQHK